jgi:hypothetical protein
MSSSANNIGKHLNMADELIAQIDKVKLPPISDVVETLITEHLCLVEAIREEEPEWRWTRFWEAGVEGAARNGA